MVSKLEKARRRRLIKSLEPKPNTEFTYRGPNAPLVQERGATAGNPPRNYGG